LNINQSKVRYLYDSNYHSEAQTGNSFVCHPVSKIVNPRVSNLSDYEQTILSDIIDIVNPMIVVIDTLISMISTNSDKNSNDITNDSGKDNSKYLTLLNQCKDTLQTNINAWPSLITQTHNTGSSMALLNKIKVNLSVFSLILAKDAKSGYLLSVDHLKSLVNQIVESFDDENKILNNHD
jgi:hypothetical protein